MRFAIFSRKSASIWSYVFSWSLVYFLPYFEYFSFFGKSWIIILFSLLLQIMVHPIIWCLFDFLTCINWNELSLWKNLWDSALIVPHKFWYVVLIPFFASRNLKNFSLWVFFNNSSFIMQHVMSFASIFISSGGILLFSSLNPWRSENMHHIIFKFFKTCRSLFYGL